MTVFMLKLYCYADETGQDAGALFFLVAVMVSEKEAINLLRNNLEEIEKMTKGKSKWKKTKLANKIKFIEELVKLKNLKNDLFYSIYRGGEIYSPLVALSVGKAIIYKVKGEKNYSVNIIIDGLNRSEKEIVRSELKSLNIRYKKIETNLKDEQDVFLRLVDGLAGFIRDYLEGDDYAVKLFKRHNLGNFFIKI